MQPRPTATLAPVATPQEILRRADAVYRLAHARHYLGFPPLVLAAWDVLSASFFRQTTQDGARAVAEIACRTMSAFLALPERDALELCRPDDGAPIALTGHNLDPKAAVGLMPNVTPIAAYLAAQKAAVIARHPALAEFYTWRAAENERLADAQHAANQATMAEVEKKAPALLLERLRMAGIALELHGGKLTVPVGAKVSDGDIEAVRKYKPQIAALLESEAAAAKPRVIA